MSGHKRAIIALQRAEQTRFAQESRRLEIVEQDFNDIKAKVHQIQKDNFQISYDSLQKRQDNFIASIGNLDSHLQELEYGISQQIVDQASLIQGQIDAHHLEIYDDTVRMIELNTQKLQNTINETAYQQQIELDQLQNQVSALYQQKQYKHEVARDALQSARNFFHSLHHCYDLDKFKPGLSTDTINLLETAEQNLINGFYEAGLITAQQTINRLSVARIEIEDYLLQHSLVINTTLAKGYEVLGLFDSQSTVPAVDLDGEQLKSLIDVDHWSWGAWRNWRRQCLRLVNRVERISAQLNIDEINDIHNQILDCEEALPDIISQARKNVLASQVRYNLAECIVQSLKEQGFYLEDSHYENADQRQPYLTSLLNIEGSRIKVQLSPQAESPFQQRIDLISEDQEVRTEYELKQRAKILHNTLQAYGLQANFSSIPQSDLVQAKSSDPDTFTKAEKLTRITPLQQERASAKL